MSSIFTYVAHCEGFLKVGKTENVERRIRQLQTACPLEVTPLGAVEEDIERNAHVWLAENGVRRVTGEWFEDNEQARDSLLAMGLIE